MLSTRKGHFLPGLLGVVVITASAAGGAQTLNLDPAQAARTVVPFFGTSSTSILALPAITFQLVTGVEGLVDETAARSCASDGPCTWLAGVTLPSGSRITQLELEACDDDPASKVSFGLNRHPVPMQNGVPVAVGGSTGIADTPGCALFPLVADHTVDNLSNSYVVEVSAAPGTNVRFGAVRVSYQLQVSSAPATATFTDVPTSHPFFQFIEALAASHITAGCGAGNFCPDAPLTRGQMAVFLTTALGLSFPN